MNAALRDMAMLFIDTRQTGVSAMWWITEGGEVYLWLQGARAQEVLRILSERMPEIKADMSAVAVVAGPGRFSSVRVGALYANLLARWFNVPLFAATPEDAMDDASIRSLYLNALNGVKDSSAYVAPMYDREPNITTPTV